VIVVETGPLYASIDTDDADHDRCLQLLSDVPGPLVVPLPVVIETAYLVSKRLGAAKEADFLDSLSPASLSGRDITVDHLVESDLIRAGQLCRTYADFPLGTVDACVIAVAERLGVVDIATLDRRHFSVVRPAHTEDFHLMPD